MIEVGQLIKVSAPVVSNIGEIKFYKRDSRHRIIRHSISCLVLKIRDTSSISQKAGLIRFLKPVTYLVKPVDSSVELMMNDELQSIEYHRAMKWLSKLPKNSTKKNKKTQLDLVSQLGWIQI